MVAQQTACQSAHSERIPSDISSSLISSRETTVSVGTPETDEPDFRRKRYKLQQHVHTLLNNEGRICKCHRFGKKTGNSGVVLNADGNARYFGVTRCGSVWGCPICAPTIAAERRTEIKTVLSHGNAEGFRFLFVTFTSSHQKDDDINDLLEAQQVALRAFKQYRSVRRLRRSLGYIDFISSKEATWSAKHGWHPHVHELWMCNLPPDADIAQIERELSEKWIAAMEKQGLSGRYPYALKIKLLDLSSQAGIDDYFTKLGTAADFSYEMTGAETKSGYKSGHYTPMELLDKSMSGDAEAGRVWLQYYNAYTGRKQIIMGRKIKSAYRDLFGSTIDDNPDQELVDQEDRVKPAEVEVLQITSWEMNVLYIYKQRYRVLELCEQLEFDRARDLIDELSEQHRRTGYLSALRYVRDRGLFLDPLPPDKVSDIDYLCSVSRLYDESFEVVA